MGLKFLWDTNIAIYYLQKQFPAVAEDYIDDLVENNQSAISIITEIELLCWPTSTANDNETLNIFIEKSVVYPLNENVKEKTIEIKKQFKLKLPDAVIAATAVVMNLTLISNDRSFSKIPSLKLLNPLDII
jgi:predicted nucleic acid-binding protein